MAHFCARLFCHPCHSGVSRRVLSNSFIASIILSRSMEGIIYLTALFAQPGSTTGSTTIPALLSNTLRRRFENCQNVKMRGTLQIHKAEQDYDNPPGLRRLRQRRMIKLKGKEGKEPCSGLLLGKTTVILLVIRFAPPPVTATF